MLITTILSKSCLQNILIFVKILKQSKVEIEDGRPKSLVIFIKYQPNKNKNSVNPWFTSALQVSRKQKEKLVKKKILNPTKINIETFRKYNSVYRTTIKKGKD